jgi:hypothetical protein
MRYQGRVKRLERLLQAQRGSAASFWEVLLEARSVEDLDETGKALWQDMEQRLKDFDPNRDEIEERILAILQSQSEQLARSQREAPSSPAPAAESPIAG